MLRNLSMNILVLSFILFGFFHSIPRYIFYIIVFAFFFDSLALYLLIEPNGKYYYNHYKTIKQMVDVYFQYTKPTKQEKWWFFIDRYGVSIVLSFVLSFLVIHDFVK
jgi:hypothetical protein